MSHESDPEPWTSLVLLERIRDGDGQAAEAAFARYFDRLTALARAQLSARLRRRTDPEDVVLSAYRSFFVGAREGRFALGRGGDLWRLLAAITRHKLLHRVRADGAARRSVAREVPIEAVEPIDPTRPTVEEAVALADEVEQILAGCDPLARRVLELRMQGGSHAEIAAEVGRSERTVRRTLAEIRARLADRAADG